MKAVLSRSKSGCHERTAQATLTTFPLGGGWAFAAFILCRCCLSSWEQQLPVECAIQVGHPVRRSTSVTRTTPVVQLSSRDWLLWPNCSRSPSVRYPPLRKNLALLCSHVALVRKSSGANAQFLRRWARNFYGNTAQVISVLYLTSSDLIPPCGSDRFTNRNPPPIDPSHNQSAPNAAQNFWIATSRARQRRMCQESRSTPAA